MKMFFGKKKKKDVLALSLLLVNIAGGELGKTELDEIIAVLREEIACAGLTLYGYDFEGNLSVVASTYSTVCPEWMEAQKSAFQQVIDQEWLDGVCYDVNVAMVKAYEKCAVECAIMSISVGTNQYGYLIADCKKGTGQETRIKLSGWKLDQRDEHYALYMGLAVLLRQLRLIEKVSGTHPNAPLSTRSMFISHILKMPIGSYIIYISFPEIAVNNDLEKRILLREMKECIADCFSNTCSVYELDVGVFAGVLGNTTSDRLARDDIVCDIANRCTEQARPCIIGCAIETEPATLALFCIEELARTSVAGSVHFLYFNTPANTYVEGIDVPETKKNDFKHTKDLKTGTKERLNEETGIAGEDMRLYGTNVSDDQTSVKENAEKEKVQNETEEEQKNTGDPCSTDWKASMNKKKRRGSK